MPGSSCVLRFPPMLGGSAMRSRMGFESHRHFGHALAYVDEDSSIQARTSEALRSGGNTG